MLTRIEYLNSILYVEADGNLDIHNAPDYLDKIKDYLKITNTKELILEFSKINFVASTGLRVILELYRIMQKRNGILKLKNVNKEVLLTFQTTCFDKFLFIENDSDKSEEKGTQETNPILKPDKNSVNNIIKTELNDLVKELNKWYYNVASIMGCNDRNIEANIVQTLLQDDNHFQETLNLYEKISKNEYINDWTNQKIPFNKDIQKLFGELIPKLKEIRAKITTNRIRQMPDNEMI